MSTLWLHMLLLNPPTFCPPSLLASSCALVSSIVSVSSSLGTKCQSKLLLFPDHAVGDWPTTSPWQPSVLTQRKRGKGGEERNFYASEPPLVSSSPLILVHCKTKPWTMWPSSQASPWPGRRTERGLQSLSRRQGIPKGQLKSENKTSQ